MLQAVRLLRNNARGPQCLCNRHHWIMNGELNTVSTTMEFKRDRQVMSGRAWDVLRADGMST